MTQCDTVFIGLGSNLGDRGKNLETALCCLNKFIQVIKLSSIYETQPLYYEDQGWFLNMVMQGITKLSPVELLVNLQDIEKKMGRKKTVNKGPRIIDLDILFYSNIMLVLDGLTIPHPEIQDRDFVLTPLNEIAPGFIHPKLKKEVKTLFNNLKREKQVTIWTKQPANDFINRQL